MRFTGLTAVLVAAVAALAGCGGSSSSTSSTAASGASAASSTPATSTSGTSTGAAPSFANTSNCQQLAGLAAKYAQAFRAATSGGKLDLQAEVSAYQALANAAPSDIRPDMQLAAQAFTSFATELAKVGYKPGTVPTAAQIAGVQSAVKVFEDPKFRAAVQRVGAWVRQNCHA